MSVVKLLDSMPRENLDKAIVDAARVSYDSESTAIVRSDRGLIRYLLRNWHTTPFEMVEFKFYMKMPIFVARQHMRHRMASVNEMSARYSVVNDEFYVPEVLRFQSSTNKQGSGEIIPDSGTDPRQRTVMENAFEVYDSLIIEGTARELARIHLPQSTYTEFIWKIDLHNLLHYLQLRMDHHAQEEIREIANKVFEIVKPLVPHTMEAFDDYRRGAVTFSRQELRLIKGALSGNTNTTGLSPAEAREFNEKIKSITDYSEDGCN